MSSNFSISFKTLKAEFSSALSAKGYEADGAITKTDFANFVLNDMQKEITSALKARDAAAIDIPGLGKLPIGDDYDDASAKLKELQQQQSVLANMLTDKGTGTGAKTMFDILAGTDGKLTLTEFKALDAAGATNGEGTSAKLTNEDFKTKFGTGANAMTDDAIATFDDKLKKADRQAIVDLDSTEIKDSNKSNTSLTSLLPKLLSGQVGIADMLPLLLGDEESNNPLLAILPALTGGGNPMSAILGLLLNKDDGESSSSSLDLNSLLPIILLMSQSQQPAAQPPAQYPSFQGNPYSGGSPYAGGANPYAGGGSQYGAFDINSLMSQFGG